MSKERGRASRHEERGCKPAGGRYCQLLPLNVPSLFFPTEATSLVFIIKILVFLASLAARVGVRGIVTLSMPVKMYGDISVWKEASRKTLARETDSAAHLPGLLTLALSWVSSLSLWNMDEILEMKPYLATMRGRGGASG